MKYAAILCILSGSQDDARALLAASEFAKRENARVKVIPSFPLANALVWADAFGGATFAAGTVQDIVELNLKARTDIQALIERTAQALHLPFNPGVAYGPGIDYLDEATPPWMVLFREAPLADVVVIGDATTRAEGFWSGLAADALLTIRTPVLIVRAHETVGDGVAAIAWDGSIASGHAVRAALPLLRRASGVVILQDPEGLSASEREAADSRRVIAYLEMQGVKGSVVEFIGGRREGEAILAAAKKAGANLLVAGAYGHARIREAVMGGATRTLVGARDGPHLLIAH